MKACPTTTTRVLFQRRINLLITNGCFNPFGESSYYGISHWVLFPMDNLHVAMDKLKRICTKERKDRQLAGQVSGTIPFMALKDEKKPKKRSVMFSKESMINDKIDKLTSLI